MEILTRKRLRSDDSDAPFTIQRKMYINQKIMDSNNSNKIKQIHDKTIEMLFKAARLQKSPPTVWDEKSKPQQLTLLLTANGEVQLRSFTSSGELSLALERRHQSKCCDRATLIQSNCSNCSLPLCEYCGYTCSGECGTYLCGACVSLFGCGTADHPLCEKCKLFY